MKPLEAESLVYTRILRAIVLFKIGNTIAILLCVGPIETTAKHERR